jgi:hypothetical protein
MPDLLADADLACGENAVGPRVEEESRLGPQGAQPLREKQVAE